MAARCASCSYPLSVSDSVSCCECFSYFHIDCAQLVGFPFYELSSDPVRNTFHCQTCKILPLPRQTDSFSDSDSDDCIMPSRQLDYHLDGQPDLAKDMNEVKGTVQDLSELCKDMFREISELKSINLTLRCCVENLRHDGEKRDGVISELRRRIEALEGKGGNVFTPIETADVYVNRISIEKEDDRDRYLTPDPEYSRLKENDDLEEGNLLPDENPLAGDSLTPASLKGENPEKENITEETTREPSESHIETPTREISDLDVENQKKEENVHFAEEENSSEAGALQSVKDWDWKGNKAIQLNENQNYSSSEDEEENEITDVEDSEKQGWEILDEDVKPKFAKIHNEDEGIDTSMSVDGLEKEYEEKKLTWADEVENYNLEEEDVESEEYTEDTTVTKYSKTNVGPSLPFQAEEETEETKEEVTEGEERTSLKEEEVEEIPKSEEEVVVVIEGDAEVEDYIKEVYTGQGSRLEGEPRVGGDSAAEEGAVPKGATEGGQSPEDQGEVQPSELSDVAEPPPPPQPQHTPDDLWDYLKETVTGEHPATVEEFVQKLIGTLEHVPEEYLKPVIDYNIKRATSPSVTDGEHLETKEGGQHQQGEGHEPESAEAHPQEDGEGCDVTAGDSSVLERDGATSGTLHEDTANFPEDPSESAEGYALEAAS